jgi:hypothetical protein
MAEPEINLAEPEIPVVTAMPPPVQHAAFPTRHQLSPESLQQLRQQGFPSGLAEELGNTVATYPLRFWVVDNSGSMRSSDGHRLRGTRDNILVVPCNRWTELQEDVQYHAELAGLLPASTTFRMLNDPGANVGPQEFSVAEVHRLQDIPEDVARAKDIMERAQPGGVTPLTAHLNEIRSRIQAVEHALRSQGQQVVVVLATDGLPSDDSGYATEYVKNEFVGALRSLQSLPVWVVVRLCTDDDEVVEYYNDLDKVLELPLEVIDDFLGEASEIGGANRWLNYALPLHRCREMGYHHRIFDLLDERLLNKDELYEFLCLLFGKDALQSAPDIHADWSGFCNVLSKVVQQQGREWNPRTRRLGPWVDMQILNSTYGMGAACCNIL